MKMCFKVLLLFLTLPAVVQAQTFTNNYGIWGYTTNADGITINITGYTGSAGAVTIPTNISGLTVSSLGSSAFSDCASLTNVTIGTNVTSIVAIAFYNCPKLTAITVNSNNPAYSSVAGVLFNQNQTTLIQCPGGAAGNYAVLDSVTNIGADAFAGCLNLLNITVPNSVITIGQLAFSNCSGLTNVAIGTNVTSIGEGAFQSCGSLMAITVATNNPAYGSVAGVLFNQNQNTLIACPGGKTGNYTVPNSVTNVGITAFFDCVNLIGITIGNNVISIGDSAFSGCNSLTNVTIGANVTSIGVNAFYDCPSLAAITVNSNNSVFSSVAGVLFDRNQTSLIAYPEARAGSYTIPGGVTNIEANAFADCLNLLGITIPDSVTTIGGGAFRYCLSLTSVTIPGSVTNIGFLAFNNCANLSGVFFQGNAPAPANNSSVFSGDNNATIYYLPGTTGWSTPFDGRPTALWFLSNPLILDNNPGFGIQSNGFGFIISWATNIPVVVEACTNLANPIWSAVSTNTLTGGSCYFSDPDSTNYRARFYRVRSP
jgi:hypothetical protein